MTKLIFETYLIRQGCKNTQAYQGELRGTLSLIVLKSLFRAIKGSGPRLSSFSFAGIASFRIRFFVLKYTCL
jgi:hypothetical protein